MLGTLVGDSFQHTSIPEQADVIIINTCGFLTSAVNESIDRILQLAQNKKEGGNCKKLIVAGCLSERYRENLLEEFPEVDAIIGTSDYTQILVCVNNCLQKDSRKSYLGKKPKYADANQNADRILSTQYHAFVKISEGCSNRCTFCNIPKLRGKLRSRPIQSIVNEIKQLLSVGIKEINLISQDSSAYGNDLSEDETLFLLVKQILKTCKDDFWLRIFYSYPNKYPTELFELMNADPRLMPYVDIPFQHVSDDVLKAMNRKIRLKEMESVVDAALKTVKNIALRTTFMVGFPTETDKDFEQLLSFLKNGYFQHVGVFTYSHEDNIVSSKYGDPIPMTVKEERRDSLMQVQQEISLKKNQLMIGQTCKVLVEGVYEETDLLLKSRSVYQGVEVDGLTLINEGHADAGTFCNVCITEAHPYDLVGGIIN